MIIRTTNASTAVLCILAAVILSCGGRNTATPTVSADAGIGARVIGTWFRIGKECDGKGDNCRDTTESERSMRWLLLKDGTGSVTERRGSAGINIPITWAATGNVITEKDASGNTFVNTVISVTDTVMVIDQPYQGRRIVNRYQKAE